MSKPIKGRRINRNPLPPLTPTIPPANEELERQSTLAIMESRLNGQQSRIADQENFFKVIKRENAALRKQVADLRAAYFLNLTLRPNKDDKENQ